jgi:hypothetical protein
LTNLDEARQALQRFYAHLRPGGLLAMSLRIYEPDLAAPEWDLDGEAVGTDGATVRRWFRCTYDVPHRLQSTEYRYEVVKDGAIIQSETYATSPDLTWYSLDDALDLLKTAGFVDVRAHANFTFESATDADTSFSVLGTRPV